MAKRKNMTRQAMVPTVGDCTQMERVLGVQVVRRAVMDDAFSALATAVETDAAQLVETHMATRARVLASTEALTRKVLEVQA